MPKSLIYIQQLRGIHGTFILLNNKVKKKNMFKAAANSSNVSGHSIITTKDSNVQGWAGKGLIAKSDNPSRGEWSPRLALCPSHAHPSIRPSHPHRHTAVVLPFSILNNVFQ